MLITFYYLQFKCILECNLNHNFKIWHVLRTSVYIDIVLESWQEVVNILIYNIISIYYTKPCVRSVITGLQSSIRL